MAAPRTQAEHNGRDPTAVPTLLGFVAIALWSTTIAFSRSLTEQLGPITAAAAMFLLAGGGYGRMTLTDRVVVDVGAGGRIYVGKYVSFRLDVRDYMFILKDDLHNELWVALGICLGFG